MITSRDEAEHNFSLGTSAAYGIDLLSVLCFIANPPALTCGPISSILRREFMYKPLVVIAIAIALQGCATDLGYFWQDHFEKNNTQEEKDRDNYACEKEAQQWNTSSSMGGQSNAYIGTYGGNASGSFGGGSQGSYATNQSLKRGCMKARGYTLITTTQKACRIDGQIRPCP
jgi:hypothetical protein